MSIANHKNVFLSLTKLADPKKLLKKTGLGFSFAFHEERNRTFFFIMEPTDCM